MTPYERFAVAFIRLMLWGTAGLLSALLLVCFLYVDFFTVKTTPVNLYAIWGVIGVISTLRCRYVLNEYREYQESLMKPLSGVFGRKN